MMTAKLNLLFWICFLCALTNSVAFVVPKASSTIVGNTSSTGKSQLQDSSGASTPATTTTTPALSESEQKVYDFLQTLHDSKFDFRIVVVGNGAILETTSPLGPTMKLGQSPASGENILTFASPDQSFEFHLMTAKVSKVALVEKDSPVTGKVMRVMRFVNDEGKMLCSLILTDDSQPAAEWYKSLVETYGQELNV